MHKSQNRKAAQGISHPLESSLDHVSSDDTAGPKAKPCPPLHTVLSFKTCPAEFKAFIEENSLENLVYWKLQMVLDRLKIQEEAPIDLLKTIVNHVEKPLLAIILKKARGNQSTAARYLGMSRNTLHRRLKEIVDEPKSIKRFWTRQSPPDC